MHIKENGRSGRLVFFLVLEHKSLAFSQIAHKNMCILKGDRSQRKVLCGNNRNQFIVCKHPPQPYRRHLICIDELKVGNMCIKGKWLISISRFVV